MKRSLSLRREALAELTAQMLTGIHGAALSEVCTIECDSQPCLSRIDPCDSSPCVSTRFTRQIDSYCVCTA